MRFWTVDEARAYLPRLEEMARLLQQSALAAARVRTDGQIPPPADQTRAALGELEEASIVVRDPAVGLFDFPAQGADGVVYLLCWRLDDPDLAWWHLPDEGFAGRKPLPRLP